MRKTSDQLGRNSLITDEQAAIYLSISENWLRQARMDRNREQALGPPFIRIGRAVRYRISDLDEWLENRLVRS